MTTNQATALAKLSREGFDKDPEHQSSSRSKLLKRTTPTGHEYAKVTTTGKVTRWRAEEHA